MTLKDCTKEELIFVIKRLQLYNLSGSHYIQLALRDVEAERDRRKFDEAKRLSNYSFQKLQEFIALMASYDGKRLVDIPDSAFNKAYAAMREVKKAEREWNKIMGIGDAKATGKKKEHAANELYCHDAPEKKRTESCP